MPLEIPSDEMVWDMTAKPELYGGEDAAPKIKVEECEALIEFYESTLKDKPITLEKRPSSILENEHCKVVLMGQCDMARYRTKEKADNASTKYAVGVMMGKLKVDSVEGERKIDMMDDHMMMLMRKLAEMGTAWVAYYRTEMWEFVWKFVETEESKDLQSSNTETPWLRDPKRKPLQLHWPGYLEPWDSYLTTELDGVSRWFKTRLPSSGFIEPEVTNACEPPDDT